MIPIDFHSIFFHILWKSMWSINSTGWLPMFFKITSFVFNRTKKLLDWIGTT